MPITLAEAKVGMTEKIDIAVVDAFRRESKLLDMLPFDNAVSVGTGGSTLTYGYLQLKTPSTAKRRTINTEYAPSEAIKEKKTADCGIFGGSFQLDRVIIGTSGALDELAFQTNEKVKAIRNELHYQFINGTKAANDFDGLKTLLAGTENEFTSEADVSTSALTDTNGNALLDELDTLIASVQGGANAILCNGKTLTKISSIARRLGFFRRERDELGRVVNYYNDIPLIDMGKYYDGSKTKDVIEIAEDGKTAIYAVRLGLDGFFGFSPAGDKLIKTYMPDLTTAGAVKTGEVEFVCGVALKNTLAAAVLKDIQIQPTTE